ncbi:MAG: LamG-like jellyroll fold domain-containing protein [Candidatus Aenigmatarchaeota archaeon]
MKRRFLATIFLSLLAALFFDAAKVSASSTDTWTWHENSPILTVGPVGAWDEQSLGGGSVVYHDGTYFLYYSGRRVGGEYGGIYAIGLATSTDGIHFTKYAGNPILEENPANAWEGGFVWSPSVIYDNGVFYMFYTARHDNLVNEVIGLATSTDGYHFTRYSNMPVIDRSSSGWDRKWICHTSQPVWDASISKWVILFSAGDYGTGYANEGEGVATSPDLKVWTKYTNNPVITYNQNPPWDEQRAYIARLVSQKGPDDKWYAYFDEVDAYSNHRSSYATSTDLFEWTRYGNNPVIENDWNGLIGAQTMSVLPVEPDLYYMYAVGSIGNTTNPISAREIGLLTLQGELKDVKPVSDVNTYLKMNLDNNIALGETTTKVLDQSTYSNNGTSYNNVTWTIEAKYGNAARFDGDGDYIQTAANNALDSANSGTVTAWIKTSSSATTQTIAAYTTSSLMSSNYVWRIRNNVLDMGWNFAGAGGNWNLINSTTPVNDGSWHFVAFVSDGLNRNKIYLDGVEEAAAFTSTGGSTDDKGWTGNINLVGSYNHHINIGGLNRGTSPQGWFNGTIDQVRIWKTALSQQEILQMFNEQFSPEFNVVSRTLPTPYVWGVGVAIGNLAGDAGNEIVLGGGTDYSITPVYGEFFAFNSAGNVLWSHQSPNRNYAAAVDIGDVDNDGDNEVAAGFLGENPIPFELLDNNGNLLWTYTYPNGMIRGVRIADVTSNPGKEILLVGGGNTGNGEVVLLDSAGNAIWNKTYTCDGHLCKLQQARIADVNNDGSNEIAVVGGWYTWDGQVRGFPNVRLLDKNGVELWTKAIGEDTLGVGIDELAASRSGLEIVVVSAVRKHVAQGSNNVTLLDSSGNTIWKIPFPYPAWSVVTGDINNDGEKEIIVGYGTKDTDPINNYDVGGVSIIDKNGKITGDVKLPNSIKFIEFGDANSDGKGDIIASCDDGKVYIISKTISVSSAADLNGDGVVDISDLAIVAYNFGKASGFNEKTDTDGSGAVDIFDIVFVASKFT